MIVVVSDTSPLRALAHLEKLDALGKLFEEVLVPPAVERELREPRAPLTLVNVGEFAFIRVRPPQDEAHVTRLLGRLDRGESEALVLALESNAAAVLIDEAAGRAAASELGLPVIGTLGLLLRMKHRQLLPSIRPMITRLKSELGFFIGEGLAADILRRAGE